MVLVSEWLEYVRRRRASGAPGRSALVLKMVPMDPELDQSKHYLQLYEKFGRLRTSEELGLFFCLGRIPEGALARLYDGASAIVSTSLGEGFGGPVVEGAIRGAPVVAPLHTSFLSVLPKDYELGLECDYRSISIKDLLGYYSPSSRWGLVRHGQLAEKLMWLESAGARDRAGVVRRVSEHLAEYCGIARVTEAADRELEVWRREAEARA